ncbi:MAG: DUF975 family protein [Clostridiales bacterium]|nr:DUF975 family protein [Clostridiales bacterium]
MWTRKGLKQKARAALKRNYWRAVLASLIYYMLCCDGVGSAAGIFGSFKSVPFHISRSKTALSGIAALAAVVLISAVIMFIEAFIINPLHVGVVRFELNALRSEGKLSDIRSGFECSYKRNVKIMFIRSLYIFIGFIFFIIPGIILSYQLMMIPYILAENPDIDRKEAFGLSSKYMEGNKWNAFVLGLSFILWHILGVITHGIADLFYTEPYVRLTHAAFYDALKI